MTNDELEGMKEKTVRELLIELIAGQRENNTITKTHMRWLIWTVIALALGRGGIDMVRSIASDVPKANAQELVINK